MKNDEEGHRDDVSPVRRAFYESFIFRHRWNATRLYALNMAASREFKEEVKHLNIERKITLKKTDEEIKKTKEKILMFRADIEQVRCLPERRCMLLESKNLLHPQKKESKITAKVKTKHAEASTKIRPPRNATNTTSLEGRTMNLKGLKSTVVSSKACQRPIGTLYAIKSDENIGCSKDISYKQDIPNTVKTNPRVMHSVKKKTNKSIGGVIYKGDSRIRKMREESKSHKTECKEEMSIKIASQAERREPESRRTGNGMTARSSSKETRKKCCLQSATSPPVNTDSTKQLSTTPIMFFSSPPALTKENIVNCDDFSAHAPEDDHNDNESIIREVEKEYKRDTHLGIPLSQGEIDNSTHGIKITFTNVGVLAGVVSPHFPPRRPDIEKSGDDRFENDVSSSTPTIRATCVTPTRHDKAMNTHDQLGVFPATTTSELSFPPRIEQYEELKIQDVLNERESIEISAEESMGSNINYAHAPTRTTDKTTKRSNTVDNNVLTKLLVASNRLEVVDNCRDLSIEDKLQNAHTIKEDTNIDQQVPTCNKVPQPQRVNDLVDEHVNREMRPSSVASIFQYRRDSGVFNDNSRKKKRSSSTLTPVNAHAYQKEGLWKLRSKSFGVQHEQQLPNFENQRISTSHTQRRKSSLKLLRNYDDFYDDNDFLDTTAKFISRPKKNNIETFKL